MWAAYKMYEQWGSVPAAGAVAGIGEVAGVPCMIIANDATVKAGAFFPQTAKKLIRAQRIAFECALPIIYLVDSSGVFLPMQDEIFPDEDDFGRIFRNNSVISAAGIPQFAAIMGNCVAGGAYLPVLCDKVLMTEGSGLYLAGPSLVKAAIGQVVEAEELGGAHMHAEISGTVDFYEKDDLACLKRLRSLVAHLPEAEAAKDDGAAKKATAPAKDPDAVYDLIGLDGQKQYDARDLLALDYRCGFARRIQGRLRKDARHRLRAHRRAFSRDRGQSTPSGPDEKGGHPDGRRHLLRQRRQGRALCHGLQSNRVADHFLPGRNRLHGRAGRGTERHHSQRRRSWSTRSAIRSCPRSRSWSAVRLARATMRSAARLMIRALFSPGRTRATP